MWKKEAIWNIALLIIGTFLVFAYSFRFSFNTSIIPGWHDPNSIFTPFGYINEWAASLTIGICLIIFRYVLMGILLIKNSDLRLSVLLISYLLPLLLILTAYHYSFNDMETQFAENYIPIEKFKNKIKQLRQYGLFKTYSNQSDEFIADILLGRFLRGQGGYFSSRPLMTDDFKDIRHMQLLRFDTAKTWSNNHTEWVIEGNHAYENFIKELGNISEEHFKPVNIKEQWLDKQTIEISFDIGGTKHIIKPKVNDDWADTSTILTYINGLIKETGYQFYYAVGEDILIIGLSGEEKKKLTENLNIRFENPLDKKQ